MARTKDSATERRLRHPAHRVGTRRNGAAAVLHDTMIPIEQVSDFYQVVGHNTDYVIAAEECIADNFGFLIGYGFNGHYDFVDNKIQFVPYQSPQLIQNIHKTMLELYPRP